MSTPPAAATALTSGAPIWFCHPNLVHCQRWHARKQHKEGGHYDSRRFDGAVMFAKCDDCESYYVAVFYAAGRGIVHCYAISETHWRWWTGRDGIEYELDEDQPIQHLLSLLGYNPSYTPTNPTTGRPQPR